MRGPPEIGSAPRVTGRVRSSSGGQSAEPYSSPQKLRPKGSERTVGSHCCEVTAGVDDRPPAVPEVGCRNRDLGPARCGHREGRQVSQMKILGRLGRSTGVRRPLCLGGRTADRTRWEPLPPSRPQPPVDPGQSLLLNCSQRAAGRGPRAGRSESENSSLSGECRTVLRVRDRVG